MIQVIPLLTSPAKLMLSPPPPLIWFILPIKSQIHLPSWKIGVKPGNLGKSDVK
jgi:hypothetical protein